MAAKYLLQGMWRPLKVAMTDRYSGAKRDVTVVQPASIPDGWYWYGQKAKSGHLSDLGDSYFLVRPHPDNPDEPLAQPVEFKNVWGMSGRGGNNNAMFGLWRAVPPEGYEVVSDIFNHNSRPRSEKYVCVSRACLVETSFRKSLWDDQGSGARQDGSMWEINDGRLFRPFRANAGYDKPAFQAWFFKMSTIQMVE